MSVSFKRQFTLFHSWCFIWKQCPTPYTLFPSHCEVHYGNSAPPVGCMVWTLPSSSALWDILHYSLLSEIVYKTEKLLTQCTIWLVNRVWFGTWWRWHIWTTLITILKITQHAVLLPWKHWTSDAVSPVEVAVEVAVCCIINGGDWLVCACVRARAQGVSVCRGGCGCNPVRLCTRTAPLSPSPRADTLKRLTRRTEKNMDTQDRAMLHHPSAP